MRSKDKTPLYPIVLAVLVASCVVLVCSYFVPNMEAWLLSHSFVITITIVVIIAASSIFAITGYDGDLIIGHWALALSILSQGYVAAGCFGQKGFAIVLVVIAMVGALLLPWIIVSICHFDDQLDADVAGQSVKWLHRSIMALFVATLISFIRRYHFGLGYGLDIGLCFFAIVCIVAITIKLRFDCFSWKKLLGCVLCSIAFFLGTALLYSADVNDADYLGADGPTINGMAIEGETEKITISFNRGRITKKPQTVELKEFKLDKPSITNKSVYIWSNEEVSSYPEGMLLVYGQREGGNCVQLSGPLFIFDNKVHEIQLEGEAILSVIPVYKARDGRILALTEYDVGVFS